VVDGPLLINLSVRPLLPAGPHRWITHSHLTLPLADALARVLRASRLLPQAAHTTLVHVHDMERLLPAARVAAALLLDLQLVPL